MVCNFFFLNQTDYQSNLLHFYSRMTIPPLHCLDIKLETWEDHLQTVFNESSEANGVKLFEDSAKIEREDVKLVK